MIVRAPQPLARNPPKTIFSLRVDESCLVNYKHLSIKSLNEIYLLGENINEFSDSARLSRFALVLTSVAFSSNNTASSFGIHNIEPILYEKV